MANGRIRGITIELSTETKGLYKGLQEARTAANNVQKALRDVNSLLKFSPGNTELLTQKQKLLGEKVTETSKRLEEEKRLLQELENSADSSKTVEQQEALKRQIEATEQELRNAQKELREFGSVGAQQAALIGEKMQEVGRSIKDFGKKWTQNVSLPLAAGLTAAGKGAMDFQDSMAKVHTLTDDAVVSFEELTEGVMALSDKTGRSGTELAGAMYQALSASVDAGEALGFTEKAASLARAGFLDTAGAVDVLTTILNAYQKEASETEKISDLLIQTQNDGKTTVNELAQQMGQVIPTAAAYNISLENLTSAYALMTKNGINTANSTTYLNGMFTELARQGSNVSKILDEKTGKTFGQLMEEGKSLGDVLQILYDSVGGNAEEFANLWGNVRAGRGALTLAQQGSEGFNKQLEKMNNASGNVEKALKKLDTPSLQLKKSLNQLKNTGIELGRNLLEVLQPGFDKLTEGSKKLSKWWKELPKGTKDLIVKAGLLAVAIGPLVVGIGSLISGAGSILRLAPQIVTALKGIATFAAANPFGAMALGAAAAVAAFVAIKKAIDDSSNAMGPATRAANELREAHDKTLAEVEAQGDRMDTLAERIKALNEEEELSAVQKQVLAQYVSELNELLGEETLTIDEETGKVQQNTDEIYANIEARKQAALASAYEEMIAESAKKAAEASIALQDAEAGLATNSAELEDAQKKLASATREAEARLDGMTEAQRSAINEERYLLDATKEEREAVNTLIAERADLQAALADNTEAYNLHIQEMTRMDNASKNSQGVLDNLLKKVGKTASDLSPTLQRGLRDGTYKIPQTVQELNDLIKFDQAVQNAGKAGSAVARDLQTKMREGKISVQEAASQLGRAATTGFGNAASDAESTGRSIADGLIRGMESRRASVGATAGSIAGTAITRMRAEARVESPSKLTKYIGAMLDAGLGEGMEGNIKKYITPAVEKVKESITFEGMAFDITATGAFNEPNEIAGRMQTSAQKIDLSAIYQAVKEGASAATIRSFISGREVTASTNAQNNSDLSGALAFKGAN